MRALRPTSRKFLKKEVIVALSRKILEKKRLFLRNLFCGRLLRDCVIDRFLADLKCLYLIKC